MTQPVKKTDAHIVVQKSSSPGVLIHGPHIFSVINPATGEEVERVEGYSAALAAQAKWNALANKNGQ
jgi:hypothetical protein